MPGPFYAHSGDKDDRSDWQLLHHHLKQVADLARGFAEDACPGDVALHEAAHAAGLLHDLGTCEDAGRVEQTTTCFRRNGIQTHVSIRSDTRFEKSDSFQVTENPEIVLAESK